MCLSKIFQCVELLCFSLLYLTRCFTFHYQEDYQTRRKVSVCLAQCFRPQEARTELTANFAKFKLSSVCVQQLYITSTSLPQVHWMLFFLSFPTVRYQKLDAGMSPTLSKQVIKKVTSKMRVQFTETSGDHKVSILLCPVISRIGSDAEAAIASIQGKGLCPPT